jgi:hypothetical protein
MNNGGNSMHLPRKTRRAGLSKRIEVSPEILAISADLFPGPVESHLEVDPELPSKQFLVLTVRASGKPKELVRRRREWHRRVSQTLHEVDIRLSITSTTT